MALATSTANITLAAAEAAERPQGFTAAASPLIADLCLRPHPTATGAANVVTGAGVGSGGGRTAATLTSAALCACFISYFLPQKTFPVTPRAYQSLLQ